MLVRISYPQIVIESKEVEMSEDELFELKEKSSSEQADFIYEKLDENEQNWCNGKKFIQSALESDYCSIRKVS